MRHFMTVSIPTEEYAEVKKIGSRYVAHLEPEDDGEGTVKCYETITDEVPDMAAIAADLQTWKAHTLAVQLRVAKREKIRALTAYDKSEAVNSFAITRGGTFVTNYWFSRYERSSIKDGVLAASVKQDTYRFDLREMGVSFDLDCNKFLAALDELSYYAAKAFNVTSAHEAAINALTTAEEVAAYDFTQGYPARLSFELDDLV